MSSLLSKSTCIVGILVLFGWLQPISAAALSVSIHVPEKYTDVRAGERIYFEVNIKYPENSRRQDLRLNYEIVKDGEVIAQAKFLKAIETQASFIDFIVIPEGTSKGMHTIRATISDYADLSEEVSATFHVTPKGSELLVYFFILLGAIVLMGALLMWQIVTLTRPGR